jgi:hypothetical protein
VSALIFWLYESSIATGIRESETLFPALQTVHIVSVLTVLGSVSMFDLRVLGIVLVGETPRAVSAIALPITRLGFVGAAVSGTVLFAAQSEHIYRNPFLLCKFAVLLLALINVALFHLTDFRHIDTWSREAAVPVRAKVFAGLSLGFWILVLVLGRLIAYFNV